jgi:phosphoribosylformylglycinamidine synthase
MKVAVIQFPGSNCDRDAVHAFRDVVGLPTDLVWHRADSVAGYDVVIVPGGFTYGDYLRAGALARFAPVMEDVRRFAARGGPVLGICNGFQILCEAGLLPGALARNRSLRFEGRDVHLLVEGRGAWTAGVPAGTILRIPIAHGEGRFVADPATLDRLEGDGRVAFRYVDASGARTEAANYNGAERAIAGIYNEGRNVMGMMPHPERASEAILGSSDGLRILASILDRKAA